MDAAPRLAAIPKDFLSIRDLSSATLGDLVERASSMKRERSSGPTGRTTQLLSGVHIALLFEKPSLRTRSTFEIAVNELGGHTISLAPEFADGRREPLEDVARNLERWVQGLVVRTYAQGKAETLARASTRLHVINALSDEEHPCQALADMLTLRERWGALQGRTLAYVGDGNNVATSLAQAAVMLGMHMRIASPPGYALTPHTTDAIARLAIDGASVSLFSDPIAAVTGASAVYTDVWTSMGQEAESAVRRSAFHAFQVNTVLMRSAAPGALFMHCLPAHRGEEVSAEVFESAASVVFDQAENRLHTQKALLAALLGV